MNDSSRWLLYRYRQVPLLSRIVITESKITLEPGFSTISQIPDLSVRFFTETVQEWHFGKREKSETSNHQCLMSELKDIESRPKTVNGTCLETREARSEKSRRCTSIIMGGKFLTILLDLQLHTFFINFVTDFVL